MHIKKISPEVWNGLDIAAKEYGLNVISIAIDEGNMHVSTASTLSTCRKPDSDSADSGDTISIPERPTAAFAYFRRYLAINYYLDIKRW